MRSLALDLVTGDLAVSAGRLTIVEGADAVRQRLQMRLRFWQGEWFADTAVGVPYLGFLGVKGAEAFAESTLRAAITTCPGVLALERFTFSVNGATRRATVSFRALVTDGEVVDVRDFVAGGA